MVPRLAFVLATLMLISMGCTASGDTVIVKPSSLTQTGWFVTIQSGTGDISPAGDFVAGPATAPAGKGSFSIRLGQSYKNPLSKVYLGTNKFKSIRLDKITQLKVSICPQWRENHRGQPAQVEIAVPGKDGVCLLTFDPWGHPAPSYLGFDEWQEFDLMGTGSTWVWTNASDQDDHGNWSWVLRRFADASIATPATKDWPNGTVSGCGLNIKAGAGAAIRRTDDEHPYAWANESAGCQACVDKLVVGYKDEAGQEIVTTYDFEPE